MILLLTDVTVWLFWTTLSAPFWLTVSLLIGVPWAVANWWPRW